MTRADDPLSLALRWSDAGKGVSLATVVSTWGSSPCPVGSQLVVGEGGDFAGSVSGGCIEAAVVRAALDVIGDGRPQTLSFGVSDERAWSQGLACGGRVEVYVERVETRRELIEAVVDARAARRVVAVVTELESGDQWLLDDNGELGATALSAAVRAGAQAAIVRQRSGRLAPPDDGYFVHLHLPVPRLLAVGAVHIAQRLAPMAVLAGWEVTVIDPRTAFADPRRFPAVTLDTRWPDRALADLGPDRRSAVVVLSHDPKFDDPALIAALRSSAFYVGALGSRRTHAKRVERLRAAGLAERDIARIHAPIGLDLGARGAAEIAVSVLAEMTGVWHGRA